MGFINAAMMNMLGLLASTTTVVDSASWQAVIDNLTSQISWGNVVSVLAGVVVICVSFAFGWWGLRKVIGMIMAAFKKGKVSV